jgi:hypothetical protein
LQVAHQKACFVLCSDGRLDQGEWGYNDNAYKAHNLGYNTFGLMAGDWPTCRDLCTHIEQRRIAGSLATTPQEFTEGIESPVQEFCKSPLCQKNATILVTGFLQDVPIMVRVEVDDNRTSSVAVSHDYDATGEGAYASITLLKWRGYDPLNATKEMAAYLLYEAKRFSESVASVGPKTRIKLHLSCGPSTEKNQYSWLDFDDEKLSVLEAYRKRFFIQPIGDMEPIAFRLEGPPIRIGPLRGP